MPFPCTLLTQILPEEHAHFGTDPSVCQSLAGLVP
jgi:hypothetical protein